MTSGHSGRSGMGTHNEDGVPIRARTSLSSIQHQSLQFISVESEGKSARVACMMMINAILGAGVLAIPNAVYKTGWLLASSFLGLVTVMACVCVLWLVEVQSRLQVLVNMAKWIGNPTSPDSIQGPCDRPLSRTESLKAAKDYAISPGDRESLGSDLKDLSPPEEIDYILESNEQIFEVNEMAQVFLGQVGQRAWEVSVALYIVCACWLYAAVVAVTLLSVIPIPNLTKFLECDPYGDVFPENCQTGYKLSLLVILCLYTPLCFIDLNKLARIQVALNFFGWSLIATMIVSICSAAFLQPYELDGTSHLASPPYVNDVPVGNFNHLSILFATCILCQMGTFAVPSITRAIGDKSKIRVALSSAFIGTFSIYLALALPAAFYFGAAVQPTVTLNWRDLNFFEDDYKPLWLQIMNTVVMTVPCFTISCTFPLYIESLGMTIATALPEKTWRMLACLPQANVETQPFNAEAQIWPHRRVVLISKCLCLIPAFALAFVQRDAQSIVQWSGMFGFPIMFWYPAGLQLASIMKLRRKWPSCPSVATTPYSNAILSSPWMVGFVFVCSGVGFVCSLYGMIYPHEG